MSKDVFLDVKNVSKTYRQTSVVLPFDLTMKKAEIIALCGGNGAGKSTIIKMIAGVIQPTTGTIYLNNLTWNKARIQYAQQLSYMPDDFQLNQPLSIFEYLNFYASLKGATKHVVETLELVGLKEKKDQLISKLSKGMRQRLLLGQAIVSKPKLILLDEPTNGLDQNWIESFNEIIVATKANNQGTVFSTHNLTVAEKIADQIIFMKNGSIKEKIHFDSDQHHDLSNYYREIFV